MHPPDQPRGAAPPVDEIVAFLSRPEAYTPPAGTVTVRQTHLSWLFITDSLVYKLKKPLAGDLFDFRTAAARRVNCELELRLNTRLAPQVYLAVVPVTLGPGGLAIGGPGAAVDWLVKMVRLPHHRMLDAVLRAGTPEPDELEALSRLLIAFYRRARPEPVTADALRQRLLDGAEQSAAACRRSASPAFRRAADRLAGSLKRWIGAKGSALTDRAAQGRFGELHGDLRPEHVYLGPPAAVIDCLEFNRDLRRLDPAEELSYFALECDLLGAREVGALMIRRYAEACADAPKAAVVAFYTAWRALLRARQCVQHEAAPGDWPPSHWRALAADYLHLGLAHAAQLDD